MITVPIITAVRFIYGSIFYDFIFDFSMKL